MGIIDSFNHFYTADDICYFLVGKGLVDIHAKPRCDGYFLLKIKVN